MFKRMEIGGQFTKEEHLKKTLNGQKLTMPVLI